MDTVTSADGTSIAYWQSGSGPAILIAGGSLADHHFYEPLAEALSTDFTVYLFDRRGRGQSGDTPSYAVERETEDVAALLTRIGEPVCLYGHSAGSALALRVAAAGLDVASLILADPPWQPHGDDDAGARATHAEQAAHLQHLNDRGDHRASVASFLADYGLSDDDLAAMLDSPSGASMIDLARTLPYDYAMLGDGLVPTDLARRVTIPTLVLAASDSPETGQALAASLPIGAFRPVERSLHELPAGDIATIVTEFLEPDTARREHAG